jgi:Cys-tRNA(Pro) deacylase
MSRPDYPITPAVRFLRAAEIPFEPRLYRYEEHGGTARAAAELGVPEHRIVKTLVFEADGQPCLVLMHGDREVSTRGLARALGAKRAAPCDVAIAERHTGYVVGGISPFGTRTRLRVLVESTILELDRICINGGKRGFLVEIAPAALAVLDPTPVAVAVP